MAQPPAAERKVKLQNAIKSVHDGMSIRRAAEEYSIPRSTLFDHFSGKVSLKAAQ